MRQLLILVLSLSSLGIKGQELVLSDNSDQYALHEFISMFKDEGHSYSIDQLKANPSLFQPVEGEIIGEGFSTARYWFRLIVTDNSSTNWVLECENNLLDTLFLYLPSEKGFNVKKSGLSVIAAERELQSTTLSFELPQGLNSDTLYIKTASEILSDVPIKIISKEKFEKNELFTLTFYALDSGILILFIIFNLVFFIQSRQWVFFFLVLYSMAAIAINLHFKGISHIFFYPDELLYSMYLHSPFVDLLFFLGLCYFYFLVKDSKGANKVMPILKVLIVLFLFGVFGYLWMSRIALVIYHNFIPQTSLIFYMICGIILWRNGNKAMIFYALGWIFFFCLSISYSLKDAAILPSNLLTQNGPALGLTAEMLFFTLATVRTYRSIENEKKERDLQLLKSDERLEDAKKQLSAQLSQNAYKEKSALNEEVLEILSARELEVVQGMVEGKTNKIIAEECNMSVNTVKTHIKSIYSKTGVNNRVDLLKKVHG